MMFGKILYIYIQFIISSFAIPDQFTYLAFEDEGVKKFQKILESEYITELTQTIHYPDDQIILSDIRKSILAKNIEQLVIKVNQLFEYLFDQDYMNKYDKIFNLDLNMLKKIYIEEINTADKIANKKITIIFIDTFKMLLKKTPRLEMIKTCEIAKSLSIKNFVIYKNSKNEIKNANIFNPSVFEHFFHISNKNTIDIRVTHELSSMIDIVITELDISNSVEKRNLIINFNTDVFFIQFLALNIKNNKIFFNFNILMKKLNEIIQQIEELILKNKNYKAKNIEKFIEIYEKYYIYINITPFDFFNFYWNALSSKFYFEDSPVTQLDIKYQQIQEKMTTMRTKIIELIKNIF